MLVLLALACTGGAPVGPSSPAPVPVSAPASGEMPRRRLDVVLLGTGTPLADPQRSGAATAVVVGGLPLLFDAGPGVIRQAQAAADRHSVPALAPDRLRHVFLTHLHSDHTTGLPDLILGAWVLGREQALHVWGPPGTQAMVDQILAGWSADIAVRQGVEGLDPRGLDVVVTEIRGGMAFTEEGLAVSAFTVPHGNWDVALGYRIEADGRVVVISGDTSPSEGVVTACDGCDLLVHEAYVKQAYDRISDASFHTYHRTFHTSAVQVGGIATRARAKQVVLTHQLFFGGSETMLVDEVKQGFDGPVTSGVDLQRFTIP